MQARFLKDVIMQAVSDWVQLNFGTCELGDKRRTNRLMQVAERVANNPSASLPDQLVHWSDLKAAYRLFNCDDVTFEAIARPHWELTRRKARGRTLILGDTTELDFGGRREIAKVGPTGNGSGQGFLLHNAMMVDAETNEILGIAGQTIHHREKRRKSAKRSNASQRLKMKNRESEVWGKVIEDIGPPAEDVEYVHVFDRGADNFEVYCHLLQQRAGWVIRASKMTRYVLVGDEDECMQLKDYLPQLESVGRYTLSIRTRGKQKAREAELEVRIGEIKIPRPRHVSPWVRQLNQRPIAMNVIEVVENNAPDGVEPIRWVLFTSLPVTSFANAWTVIEYYEKKNPTVKPLQLITCGR